MLLHVPDGASGTADRLIGVGLEVAVGAAGVAVAVVAVGLMAGDPEGAPGAVAPTQPAAATALIATAALSLRHLPRLIDIVPTSCPSRRSSIRINASGTLSRNVL